MFFVLRCAHASRILFCAIFLVSMLGGPSHAQRIFELDKNDQLRLAMRPVGVLRFYTGEPGREIDGSMDCAAAVITERFLITSDNCASPWKLRIAGSDKRYSRIIRAELRLGLDAWSLKDGVFSYQPSKDHIFEVNIDTAHSPANSGAQGFGFLEVVGNPSKDFGVVKLLHREMRESEDVILIGSGMGLSYDQSCKAIAAQSREQKFGYECHGMMGRSQSGKMTDWLSDGGMAFTKDGFSLIANNDHSVAPRRFLNTSTVTSQRQFWEDQVFHCRSDAISFPAKNDHAYDPLLRYDTRIPKLIWLESYSSSEECDDGDMTFFNGLLCAAGDERGCDGVRLAQGPTGQWWRAKTLIGQSDTPAQASFSTEQGLGVLNYMVKKADKNAFIGWLGYLKTLPRTGLFPSYCPHKECVFKIIDCPLLVTIASRFDETLRATSICDPLQFLHLPQLDQMAKQLEDGLKQLLDFSMRFESLHTQFANQFGAALGLPDLGNLLPSPVQELKKQSDILFQKYKETLENLLGPQIGEAAAQFAQQIALVNSVVNSLDVSSFKLTTAGKISYDQNGVHIEGASVSITGHIDYNSNGEHIAAAEVFLLRNLGYSSLELTKAAFYAQLRDKDNPFFEYLSSGRSDRMHQLITSKCPSLDRPSYTRLQWFTERGEEAQPNGLPAWAESMYWDCIFLDLLHHDALPTSDLHRSSTDPFGALGSPSQEIQKFLSYLTDRANEIQAWITKLEDAARPDKAFCNANPNNVGCILVPPDQSYCDKNPNNDGCRWARKIGFPTPGGGSSPIPGGGSDGEIPIPGGGLISNPFK